MYRFNFFKKKYLHLLSFRVRTYTQARACLVARRTRGCQRTICGSLLLLSTM